jgi:hypothetical protein
MVKPDPAASEQGRRGGTRFADAVVVFVASESADVWFDIFYYVFSVERSGREEGEA